MHSERKKKQTKKKEEEEQLQAIIQFEKSIKAAASKFRHFDDRYRVLIA